MRKYFKLMRINHYIKNILIFLPLIFGGMLFNVDSIKINLLGFLVFSFTSSVIYIVNDIMDVKQDKLHPIKCRRPIASGDISKKNAIFFAVILLIFALVLNHFIYLKSDSSTWIFLLIYILINFLYSFGLKKVPILDVIILVSGFLIRVLYGGAISGIEVSSWLILTVISISLYLSLGKRRNELKNQGECVRGVLKYYNYNVLDRFMYFSFVLSTCFYTLWCINSVMASNFSIKLYLTVPIFLLILARYSKDIEGNVDGDPVNVTFKDKWLIFMTIIYSLVLILIMY